VRILTEEQKEKKKIRYNRWRLKNLERERERCRKYYHENKPKRQEDWQRYYAENKERLCERSRNKDKKQRAEEFRHWYLANHEYNLDRAKKYREENPDKVRETNRKVFSKMYKNNPQYKAVVLLRNRINGLIRKHNAVKCADAIELIGCTAAEFIAHIEAQFQPGMTWENYGRDTWHIDHIRPCASFDMTDPEQQKSVSIIRTYSRCGLKIISKRGQDMGAIPKGVSGSRIAGILGFSPFNTPLSVWQQIMEEREPGFNEKHGYTLPVYEETAAQRWGLCFEDAIAELAERETGKRITDREKFFERDFMTCHVDGIFEDGVLYEGKTTTSFMFRESWGEPGTDHVPRYYQTQLQWNMNLAELSEARLFVLTWPETPDKWEAMGWEILHDDRDNSYYLSHEKKEIVEGSEITTVLDGNLPENWARILNDMGYFHQYPVKANPEAQRLMVEAYREFWYKNVLTGTPPEPRNYEDVKRLFPEPKSTIVVPDYIERKIAEYRGITEETANAKKRKERLKTIVTKYAAAHVGIEDDESKEAVIFRNGSGDKLGSWSKTKTGSLVFRC
jgi:putative phage-type endonuclease